MGADGDYRMCSGSGLPHLLKLVHPPVDQRIRQAFGGRSHDGFTLAMAQAVVYRWALRDELHECRHARVPRPGGPSSSRSEDARVARHWSASQALWRSSWRFGPVGTNAASRQWVFCNTSLFLISSQHLVAVGERCDLGCGSLPEFVESVFNQFVGGV